MSKRNKIISETIESEALKEMRLREGISLRKLAEKMGLSFARVHQMETGRETITEDYVQLFCKKLNINEQEWEQLTGNGEQDDELLGECFELISMLTEEKLSIVYELLKIL